MDILVWLYWSIASQYPHNLYIHIYSYENGHIGLDISVAVGTVDHYVQTVKDGYRYTTLFTQTQKYVK
jgi:hypothetical protein